LLSLEVFTCRKRLQTPGLAPFPDLTQPEVAYPQYAQPGIDARFVSRMEVQCYSCISMLSNAASFGTPNAARHLENLMFWSKTTKPMQVLVLIRPHRLHTTPCLQEVLPCVAS